MQRSDVWELPHTLEARVVRCNGSRTPAANWGTAGVVGVVAVVAIDRFALVNATVAD
jgi:hypothetical protein